MRLFTVAFACIGMCVLASNPTSVISGQQKESVVTILQTLVSESQKNGPHGSRMVEAQEGPSGKQQPPSPEAEPTKQQDSDKPKGVTSLILMVKLAFMADPRLFPYDIEVKLDDQMVTLSGKVASPLEKETAERLALHVNGVQKVVNELVVAPDMTETLKRKQDERIAQYLEDRIAKSKTLQEANFGMSVRNGIVSLTGSTRFQVIALEAAQAARQVPGVYAVETQEIRYQAE